MADKARTSPTRGRRSAKVREPAVIDPARLERLISGNLTSDAIGQHFNKVFRHSCEIGMDTWIDIKFHILLIFSQGSC